MGVWHQATKEGEAPETDMWGQQYAAERERIYEIQDEFEEEEFFVVTKNESYHRGCIFRFRVDKAEDKLVWVSSIQRLQMNVKELVNANQGDPFYIQQVRRDVRRIYVQDASQVLVAFLISMNFIVNIFESQLQPLPGSPEAKTFEILDWAFSFIFFFELLVNMFATMTQEFVSDGWNWFDAVVVLVSLVSLFSDGLPGVSVLRVLRAFRVFRLFKRIPSLKQIIVALNQSLPPMFNAFVLVMMITAIYSIMGVTFFMGEAIDITGEGAIDMFPDFLRAMFTMFGVLTGDEWGDISREYFAKPDMIPAAVAFYFVSFQVETPPHFCPPPSPFVAHLFKYPRAGQRASSTYRIRIQDHVLPPTYRFRGPVDVPPTVILLPGSLQGHDDQSFLAPKSPFWGACFHVKPMDPRPPGPKP